MGSFQQTTFQGTSNVRLPNGAINQRSSPSQGMIRFNTQNNQDLIEFYDNGAWRPVTGFSQGSLGTGGQSTYRRNGKFVHLFTSVGNHTFTPAHSGTVQVLIVGGGGSAGYDWAGGGGGGGFVYNRAFPVTSGQGQTVTVGDRGYRNGPDAAGNRGGQSRFGNTYANGGGGGGCWDGESARNGFLGESPQTIGSGGGGGNSGSNRTRISEGRATPGQGFPGGSGIRFNSSGDNCHWGGGGGGAGGPGDDAPDRRQHGRNADGGPGAATDILGEVLYFGGGGAGGAHLGQASYCEGGIGGGGGGAIYHGRPHKPNSNRLGQGGRQSLQNSNPWGPGNGNAYPYANGGGGQDNSGGGGGGGQFGAQGGTGVVIVAY